MVSYYHAIYIKGDDSTDFQKVNDEVAKILESMGIQWVTLTLTPYDGEYQSVETLFD
jgi:NRPS condensation-like uncharacterized protein